jgi:hypothetical protein
LLISGGFAAKVGFSPRANEDQVAKGQMRSNREKKKPKGDKNKKKGTPATSPFTLVRMTGKDVSGKKFS